MATLLTTSKMAPALAARIEASVRGRRAKMRGGARRPRLVALARLLLVLVIAGAAGSLVRMRRDDRRALERTRAQLLDDLRAKTASLTPGTTDALARMESWVERSSGVYDGDLVEHELRAPGALASVLARPAVYVRGPVSGFEDRAKIAQAAAASGKDSLLVCLLEPPASRAEKIMLGTVRFAYGRGSTVEEHSANVRSLHDAEVGSPYLLPSWAARVTAATEPELARLDRELRKAPIDAAIRALRAEVLIVATDEPGFTGGPTELDGERAHPVRLTIVDLIADKVVFRLRKTVDPSWISVAKRPAYARGLDGCGLALDAHDAAQSAAAPK